MTKEAPRPWLDIPAPVPLQDPDEWNKPRTRGDKDYDENLDDEKRVIIIDL
tara:strand:- start:509 stop:661 length:153 start_codon:yes stop_codon:yes gene_type:complete